MGVGGGGGVLWVNSVWGRGVIVGGGRGGGEGDGSEVLGWGWRGSGGGGGAAVVGLFAAGLFDGAGTWESGR